MSRSAEGVLFYGLWYSNDELLEVFPEPEGGEGACGAEALMEAEYAHTQKEQAAACPPPPRGEPPREYAGPEWDEWRRKVALWEAGRCDARVAGHSDNSQAVYVYVRAGRQTAEWDEVVPVGPLEAREGWDESLRAFCAALGLPWKGPRWWLTSSYG